MMRCSRSFTMSSDFAWSASRYKSCPRLVAGSRGRENPGGSFHADFESLSGLEPVAPIPRRAGSPRQNSIWSLPAARRQMPAGAFQPGDSLAQAVRRLGFSFQFNLRQGAASLADVRALVQAVSERGFLCWRDVERNAALSVPALAAAWAARPSAKLPLQRGKLPGREVKRVAQLTARAARGGQRQKRTARRVARRTAVSAKLH